MRAAIAVSAPPATSPNASLVTAANVCTVYAPVAVERLYFQAVKVVVFVESNRGSVVEACVVLGRNLAQVRVTWFYDATVYLVEPHYQAPA